MVKILKNKVFNKENKKYILLIIVLILSILVVSVFEYINYDSKGIIINGIKIPDNLIVGKISVYIDGEVNRPGYVKIFKGATIEDAINKAKGITQYADIENIDLGRVLKNKEKIVVPTIQSIIPEEEIIINELSENSKKININTANMQELTRLEGIGEKTANKIIKYRLNSVFNRIEDIMQIKGIGKTKFEKIKEDICV